MKPIEELLQRIQQLAGNSNDPGRRTGRLDGDTGYWQTTFETIPENGLGYLCPLCRDFGFITLQDQNSCQIGVRCGCPEGDKRASDVTQLSDGEYRVLLRHRLSQQMLKRQ